MRIHHSSLRSFSLLIIAMLVLSGCRIINLDFLRPNKEPTPPPQQESPVDPVSSVTPVITPTKFVALETPTLQTGLTETTIMNLEYQSPMLQVPVQLVDGRFNGVVDGVELNARIEANIQFGDLNADEITDAAWLIAEDTGGTGVFVSLMVIYSHGDGFKQADGIYIDDRPIVNSMAISDGLVTFSGLVHGSNDPMVNPTTTINIEWTLFDDRLVRTRMSSAFGGGGEHIIFIEQPSDGEEVSESFALVGTMPIGPFENNLSLLISAPLSGQLLHEGFMVQAEDMGAPATFNNLIQVPEVPPGTVLLVTLREISMEDGSPIAIDSVRVIVK